LGYSEDTFARFLPITTENQVSYQLIDRAFAETARRLKVYICYGTIGWFRSQAENREDLTIRQVVVDRLGQQVAVYDKTHLCDYGVCAETRFFRPGPASRPVSFPVETASGGSFRLGLLICADMRYPELARQLTKEHLVDGIIQPAAFARDCSFRTWKSFRETRAVENSVYWIGVNYSGKNYGDSCIVPPWVDEAHEPITMGCEEGYIVGCLSRSSLDHARSTMPFYRNLLREETTGWQSSLPVDQRGLTKAI
jgi:nitrilase